MTNKKLKINDYYLTLALKGILAGILIAIAVFTYLVLYAYSVATKHVNLITYFLQGVGFCIGIILIVSLDAALFTGRIGYLVQRKAKYLLELLIVLLTNFIGASLFSIIFYYTLFPSKTINGLLSSNIMQDLIKSKLDWQVNKLWRAFLGAIGTGILLHSGIYAYENTNNKGLGLLALLFSIWTFLLLGFDHSIASFAFFSFGFGYPYHKVLLFILIIIIGNSIGSIFIQTLITLTKRKNNQLNQIIIN